MFDAYPDMVAKVFENMFVVDGTPQKHLKDRIVPILKEYGPIKLFKEMRGALKAL